MTQAEYEALPSNPLKDFIAQKNAAGLAVGRPDIKADAVDFVYGEEKFHFPLTDVFRHCSSSGTFLLAKVEVLRALHGNHS